MTLRLQQATMDDYPVVQHLSSYYIYDMSEYLGWPCSESGRFGGCDEFFDDWRAGRNDPFMIKCEEELAGFAGVKFDEATQEHTIQEFFILRKFRRRGIGTTVAFRLFDASPGNWRVEQLAQNTPAVRFWTATITAYPQARTITVTVGNSPWGPIQTIRMKILHR
jgi:predicted acetyltransferase